MELLNVNLVVHKVITGLWRFKVALTVYLPSWSAELLCRRLASRLGQAPRVV